MKKIGAFTVFSVGKFIYVTCDEYCAEWGTVQHDGCLYFGEMTLELSARDLGSINDHVERLTFLL